ncbi:MAG TPA: BatA domain-containing protein [Phycisphaerales bacterium]|nr:BatA domain-containing protein [Phycisphaerales bacterium]
MTFLHPALLAAGVACIAIPIIIHLLMHRRRKPVMWGAMRFLLEAYKRQRRRLMLEKWLLLACRCLILLLLALAIGRPLLGRLMPGTPGKTIYILIDNGLASGTRDTGAGTALDRHKAAAKAVLKSLRSGLTSGGAGESDRVALITLGGPAEGLVLPASANLGSVETIIDTIEPTDSRTDLPGGVSLIAGALSPVVGSGEPPARPDRTFVVLLSDYLDGSADLSPTGDAAQSLASIRLPEGVRLISSSPESTPTTNTSIIAVEPLRSILVDSSRASGSSADLSELVRIQLRRTGDLSQPAISTVRARLAPITDGEAGASAAESPGDRATVRWTAGQETATAIVPVRTDRTGRGAPSASGSPRAATAAVIVASIDDDALPADNRWRRPVELRDALRVGVVAPVRFGKAERIDQLDPATWARFALSPTGENSATSGVDVIDIEPASIDAARLAGLDAVVLPRPDLLTEQAWARLRLFIDAGGLVLVTPPPSVTVNLWGDAMTRSLGLSWTVARESRDATGRRLSIPQSFGATADPGANGQGSTSLLNLVQGELADLISPVNVFRTLPMAPAPETGETLLALDDNTPIMWAGAPGAKPATGAPDAKAATPASGRGLLVYLAIALDLGWSDLPAKPLMVPLVQEVLRQGVGRARGSWSALAGSRPTLPTRTSELLELPDPARISAERDRAPGRVRVDGAGISEPVRRAGLWRAVDDRGLARGLVAVNPDPRGSRTNPQPRDAVAASLALLTGGTAPDAVAWLPPSHTVASEAGASIADAVSTVFGRADAGSPIAWPLLIGALLLAIVEIVLARRASHADTLAPASSTTILPGLSMAKGGA